MHPLEIKTTATLLDEMITTEFKIAAGNKEASNRRHQLGNIITSRMGTRLIDINFTRQFWPLEKQLRKVLRECWEAQETVHATNIENYSGELTEEQLFDNILSVAKAGVTAQRTNAERNSIIRQLDELLEESQAMTLEKTYA